MTIRIPHKTVITSGATLVNAVIYPYPCTVHAVHVAHGGGASMWIQMHDWATVPPEGTVPLISHEVGANTDANIEGIGWPFYFSNGVYINESDTIPTKTLSAAGHIFVTVVIEVPDVHE